MQRGTHIFAKSYETSQVSSSLQLKKSEAFRARTARPDGARAAGGVAGKRARAADARRPGEAPRAWGRGGAPAGRTGRRDPHPRHHRGAPATPWRETVPDPRPPPRRRQHPEAACGARRRSRGGETDPRRPGGPGASARARGPLLPSRGRQSPPRPQSLRGDAVSALRGTEGPAGPARTAPSRAPRRGD